MVNQLRVRFRQTLFEEEFQDLIKRFGRKTTAESVAVVLLTERKLSVEDVVKYTGLNRDCVERLKKTHEALSYLRCLKLK